MRWYEELGRTLRGPLSAQEEAGSPSACSDFLPPSKDGIIMSSCRCCAWSGWERNIDGHDYYNSTNNSNSTNK